MDISGIPTASIASHVHVPSPKIVRDPNRPVLQAMIGRFLPLLPLEPHWVLRRQFVQQSPWSFVYTMVQQSNNAIHR